MLVWTGSAEADLQRNIERYAETDPLTAWRIYGEVIERAEALAEHPRMGRRGRITGTKELVLKGTPFILVYRVAKDQVEVLRVLHGAQAWPEEGNS